MVRPGVFSARGEIELPTGSTRCDLTVGSDGVIARDGDDLLLHWPAHEIARVTRDDYELLVTNVFDEQQLILRRFARRTDELEIALRRSRADALAALMAPPSKRPLDVFEATSANPGLLYRHDDGLRWVPHEGDCCARLYSEIGEALFDPDEYALVLDGPFGETRINGLRRLTREITSESARHIEVAREEFADALEAAGIPWREEARAGTIHAHVPFDATDERLEQVAASNLICAERRDYWEVMREENAIERLILSPAAEGIRTVALGRGGGGELYETLYEPNHATYVFERVDDVVRAWTEVGFRREPIFSPSERDAAAVLALVLPSLRAAREGLLRRMIHDSPQHWRQRLF